MKKALSILLSVLLLLSVFPFGVVDFTANAETSGYYTYTISNGKATITDVDTAISGAVTVPTKLGNCDVVAIGSNAFNACSSVKSVVLPETVTSIGAYSFYDCSMASINIPEAVTTIGSYAFFSTNIKTLTIPKNVTSIGSGIVDGCHYITAVNVDSANSKYSSVDGVLFSKDKTKLITYPMGKGVAEYTVPEGVTIIGNAAFKDTPSTLKKVNLPSTLTTIDVNAFRYCIGLTNIIIPNGVKTINTTAFYSCTKLATLTLPKSVITIGGNAFSLCSALKTVYYMGSESDYASVTVGENPILASATWYYNSCVGTTNHTYSNACDAFCNVCEFKRDKSHTYDGDSDAECNVCGENRYLIYTITNGEATITDIDSALSGNVTIPATMGGAPVVAIGDYAFNGGTAVTSVTLPNTVKTIGAYAFYNTGITSMNIPEGVTKIGNYAFANNGKLKSINIPSSVTSIGTAVVLNCTYIESINVNEANNNYSSLDGVLFNKAKTTIILYPKYKIGTEYNIPNTVTTIGGSAFKNCTRLKKVTIPYGVSVIGMEAFSNASGITDIVLPDTVKSVNQKAFYFCTNLKTVTLSKNIETIADNAFLYSSAITDVFYRGSEEDLTNVSISTKDDGNKTLLNATWHFNSCVGSATHTYDNACDTTCNVCGDVREVGDHIYDNDCDAFCNICDTQREVSDHIYDNDCDTNCNICGAVRTVNGHVYNYDCDAFCNVCGYERTPAAHKYDNDCDTDCNDCGEIRAITHTYDDSSDLYCNVCGDLRYLSYTVSNKQVTITDCENFYGEMAIPETINGYPVTKIGERAFENCNGIDKIVIPSSVTYVGAHAFDGCSNIYELTIPGSITEIADSAFYSIVNLRTLTIEEGVKSIGGYAFSQCVSLTNVTIPDSVTNIGAYAFSECRSIKTLEIGKGVKSIGQDAFRNCGYLTSITVDEENQSYSGKGNCLVEKSSGTLIRGCKNSVIPADGSVTSIADYAFYSYYGYFGDNPEALEFFVIPNGVTYIGEYAFSGFGIKKLVLPEGLTAVEKLAFYDCDKLTEIVWPSTLKYIKESVFKDCRNVTDVWFCGDVDDYIAIEYTGSNNHYVYHGTATWHLNICKNGKHTYTNGCADATCANCEWSKLPTDHIFDDDCDAECNVCGLTVREPNHIYDNTCDTTCNNCGEVREITHSYVSVVTKPTCTNEGYTTNTCSVCGEVKVDSVVAPLGHTPSEAVVENRKESTCTEDGTYESVVYCGRCDEELSRETIVVPALGHALVNHEAKDPTCTEIGWNDYVTCENCDYTTYNEIPENGHVEGEIHHEDIRIPTCTTEGEYVQYAYCTVCGVEVYREYFTGPPLEHLPSLEVEENRVEPTCTEDGLYDLVVYCDLCGVELSRETNVIPAIGHDEIHHDAKVPTCTEIGWNDYVTCSRCDYTTYEEIPENGHTAGEPVEENRIEADCENNGSYDNVVYCAVCNQELSRKTEVIPAKGHTDGDAIPENEVEPGCTTDGSYDVYVYCADCDKLLYIDPYVVPALGHLEGEIVVENKVDATCTEDGSYDNVVYCVRCDEELSRKTEVIPALGHDEIHHDFKTPTCTNKGWHDYVTCSRCDYTTYKEIPAKGHSQSYPVVENRTEADCENDGSYDNVYYCELCFTEFKRETVTIPANGHTEGEAVVENEIQATCSKVGSYDVVVYCSVCGKELSRTTHTIPVIDHTFDDDSDIQCNVCGAVRYITYTITNGNVTITSVDSTLKGTIVVPSVIEGCDVTTIGEKAFNACKDITNIVLPNTVTTIASYAFYASGIRNITLSDSLVKIGSYAFTNCYFLTTLNIPASVTSIGTGFILDCYKIAELNVDNDNASYSSIDGVLFSKDKTLLVTYPHAKSLEEYVIPEGVKTIGASAFKNCHAVKKVVIPNTTTFIDAEAFSNCSALSNVVIPNSVTRINTRAFYLCKSLKTVTLSKNIKNIGKDAFIFSDAISTVYYMGSKEDYANITIDTDNSALVNATWYYNSCIGTTVHKYSNNCDFFCNVCEYKRENAHTYDNDSDIYCNNCGENRYIIYTITNGLATVTDINTALSGNVIIPATLGGASVVAIGDYAFNGGANITNITIPNSVTTIGNYAFYNCGIKNITIPNGVKSIGNYAFANCYSLTEINISETVETLGTAFVLNCGAILKINVNKNNANYCSVDGVLFNKDKTTVVIYPQGKKDKVYVIPEGVTVIGNSAFKNSIYLEKVVIPGTVSEIKSEAFSNCRNMVNVYIPNSVTTIASKAFYYCVKLANVTLSKNIANVAENAFLYSSAIADVYYMGSEEDFANVVINSTGNSAFVGANWHYNCDTDCKDHNYDNAYDTECNVCGQNREKVDLVLGDVNGDASANLKDLVMLSQYVAMWENLAVYEPALDVNDDGEVNLEDVNHLARYLAGWNV